MTLNRRDFIKASGAFAAWAALAACTPLKTDQATPTPIPTSTPQPQPPADDPLTIILTLNRTSLGATPEMYDRVRAIGLNAFLDEQMHPETITDTAADGLLTGFPTLSMSPGERLQYQKSPQPIQELTAATLLKQWQSRRQLHEVMVDFWSNHFNIYIYKSSCRVLKTDDDLNVIRPNTFSKFGDILSASAHSPAMLFYLDNADSRKQAPNENYARELMELHTLSVNGGYSQADVFDVARALTGWGIAKPDSTLTPPGTFQYDQRVHDDGQKTILGTVFPAGGGEQDGVKLLDQLAHHPMTARFISAKLARRFVSDIPDASLVDSLARVFTQSDGDTRAVLKAIFSSEAFKNSAGQKMKRPMEFMVSALRLTGASLNGSALPFEDYLGALGQAPFTWQTPDGFPDQADFWRTTSGLLERWNFGILLTSGQVDGAQVDVRALTRDAGSAQDVVDVLSKRFLGALLPQDARSILVDFASGGNLDKNLPAIAGLILGSPHFQVR